jgi:hypothetical protein
MANELELRMAENLRLWKESSQSRFWVIAHRGQWGHLDWVDLVEALQQSAYWPIDLIEVGKELEALREQYANLVRWRGTGQAHTWVEARHGRWGEAEWHGLLDTLRASEFWPIEPDALGWMLEEIKREWINLRRWEASGQPHLWVASHGGTWTHDDWLALVETLRHSDFWPIDLIGAGLLLECIRSIRGLAA